MKTIIRTTPERGDYRAYLERHLPDAEWIVDDARRGARATFIDALRLAGDDPALILEDDIILTEDFMAKALSVCWWHPSSVIQFFSMRGDDLTVGSRWDRKFAMNQCTYFPAGYGPMIADYLPRWPARDQHTSACDILVNDWLRSRREPYWLHVPSLVEHRIGVSAINPSRSSKRQSKTFRDPAT